MVKLTKIYTRTGDTGETGLGDGSRTDKDDARVEAYGSVDEANADLGVARVTLGAVGPGFADQLNSMLGRIQNDMFDVGADLCTPAGQENALRVAEPQIEWLEAGIDGLNADLPALTSFVLPGGSASAAALHVARASCRRAERRVWTFHGLSGEGEMPGRYLNRLSDLLFVMSRVANRGADVLWVPGEHREGEPSTLD